jgi:hypothetical protein
LPSPIRNSTAETVESSIANSSEISAAVIGTRRSAAIAAILKAGDALAAVTRDPSAGRACADSRGPRRCDERYPLLTHTLHQQPPPAL